MPLVLQSSYTPPPLLRNGHLQTIYANIFRRVQTIGQYARERISTPDNDFLDLDWSQIASTKLAVISYGLEGNANRVYVRAMVHALRRASWSVLVWNYRGCSGELNRQLRSYHSGETTDLHTVISHVLAQKRYSKIGLIGFSLGGNIVLKYLGERGKNLHPLIKKAIVFSVPCDLAASAEKLAQGWNRGYLLHFLRQLKSKAKVRMERWPGFISSEPLKQIKDFRAFDDWYTAPIHGFVNADEYWEKCSSVKYLSDISIPTLLVNARDDPFLTEVCFPIDEAQRNANLFLEMPAFGGHVGFVAFNKEREYWSERRSISFLTGIQ